MRKAEMKRCIAAILFLIGFVLVFAAPARAVIVDLPDANGWGYFRDQSTGYTWMDVDNFLNKTYSEVLTAIAGTGFRMATHSEILALQAAAPAYTNVYASHAEIMGDAPWSGTRLIWGLYDDEDGNNLASWSWKWQGDNSGSWNYNIGGNEINFFTGYEGMGAFVLSTGDQLPSVVPEPATMMLFGIGLTGMALKKRWA